MAITWSNTIEALYGNGLLALSGSNLLILGIIVSILFVWFMLKVGAPAEVAIPAAIVMIMTLSFYTGALPTALFTGALIISAIIIALAFNKVFRQ